MATEEPLRRRHDDFVTFREMVEYFAKQEAEWHTMRAESFVMMNSQLEKLDSRFEKAMQIMTSTMAAHEEWHRTVLQGIIDRGTSNKIASGALLTAIVGMIISTVVGVIQLAAH